MKFNENESYYTCSALERGIRFTIEGVRCCSASTLQSPPFITAEEMAKGGITYEYIINKKKELFEAINNNDIEKAGDCLKCHLLHKKPYKEIDFGYIGGAPDGCSSFNIAHYSICNLRCKFCVYTVENNFLPPQYDNIIEYIEEYRKNNKILPNTWVDYNGGEPTLLANFEEILNYLISLNIGEIGVYSNCVKYSETICNSLAENKIVLITSIDSGTRETFKQIKGADAYDKVISNIKKYQENDNHSMMFKFIICEENMNDNDLFGFVKLVEDLKPNRIGIGPDFCFGIDEVPRHVVEFGAKLLFELNKVAINPIHIMSDYACGDAKFIKYSKDIRDLVREKFGSHVRIVECKN